jgi:hypothetical protein
MGVLDDAIREHLELKRRHGASDEEVAQEEAEALGPARRDFPAQPAPEEAVADESAEPAADEQIADEQIAEEPGADEATLAKPPPPEPELGTENWELGTQSEQPPHESQDETDEDVLEDTPEFLQDAPEHDRLWFEQKPPRDFDFE